MSDTIQPVNGVTGFVKQVPYSVVKDGVVTRTGLCPESQTSTLKPECAGERIIANIALPIGEPFEFKKVKPLGVIIKELEARIAALEAALLSKTG